MIPKIVVHPDGEIRIQELEKMIASHNLHRNHPDILWIEEEKLGVEQARQIREHLSLKPSQALAKGVVVVHAQNFSVDGQNALLKTLEEPVGETVILLGVTSDDSLLPTITSRSQMVFIGQNTQAKIPDAKDLEKVAKLAEMTMEQRFQVIEKLDDRPAFFEALVYYYQQQLKKDPSQLEFVKALLEAEKWVKANVNIRAVLEYLMLRL